VLLKSIETYEPPAVRNSAATVGLSQGRCELRVPYVGHLTRQTETAVACALRQLLIELRYGMRLKGLTVAAGEQVLTVSIVASNFALQQWLDSGELVAAVDCAFRRAHVAVAR
jgi:hypothetical protein